LPHAYLTSFDSEYFHDFMAVPILFTVELFSGVYGITSTLALVDFAIK